VGVDIGALWVAGNYQLGAQLTNINQPTFDFPDVNLEPYSNPDIIGFLQRDKVYVMDRQLKLEASLFSRNRRWTGNLGVDANAATDPLGDDYQWLTLSTGYTMDNWWLPNVRLGYRQNLAGTELGYLSVGFTAFRFVNVDIASALDTVSIDGTTLPQGLMTSIGFQINW
ncbi:MAG: conjugal transfer protein TraF, partial [Woeseiaceae bacterium]|nr:conjugal transfer protein TraF [Woeseiaceae bacterium]